MSGLMGFVLNAIGDSSSVRSMTLQCVQEEGYENLAHALAEKGFAEASIVERFPEDTGEYLVFVTTDGRLAAGTYIPAGEDGRFLEWDVAGLSESEAVAVRTLAREADSGGAFLSP